MQIHHFGDIKELRQTKIPDKAQWKKKIEHLFNKKKDPNNQSQTFFKSNEKRIILFWSGLFILLIFLAVNFLLNIKWSDLFQQIYSSATKPRFLFTCIFSFFYFVLTDVWIQIFSCKVRTGNYLNHLNFKDWLSCVIVSFFIQTITPFAIGSEAFAIWWFKKNGVPLKEASAIVAVATFCWFTSQFLITWPSFIYLTIQNWDRIRALTINPTYWIILVGLAVDIIIWTVIFLISYSKQVHYRLSCALNQLNKFFSLEYLNKSELSYKYLVNDSFKKLYVKKLKSNISIITIGLFMLQSFLSYTLYACIAKIFLDNEITFWDAYHTINVSTTANNFLPIPSAEGSLQITIKKLTELTTTTLSTAATSGIDYTIFIWRFFGKYLGLFLAVAFIAIYGLNSKTQKPKQHHLLLDSF